MFRPSSCLAALLLVAAGIGPAASQTPTDAQKSAVRSACRADFQANCAGVAPGGQASFACLQQNYSSLSPPCQSAVGAIAGGQSSAAPNTAQHTTAQSAPGQSTPGQSTPGQSVSPYAQQPHPSTATPPPHPASPRAEAGIVAHACRFDYREFCRGIRPGGGEVLQCLKANGPSLSPQCRGALTSLRAR